MRRKIVSGDLGLTLLLMAIIAAYPFGINAEVPQLINYQGYLTDSDGNPVTDTMTMTFTIYNDSAGGVSKWTETQSAVNVDSGNFSVLLGKIVPINDSVFAETNRWLGIRIHPDEEIIPRTKLSALPYAYISQRADTARVSLVGGGWITDSGCVALSTEDDNVGIGVEDPLAKLHVNIDEERTPAVDPFRVTYGGETFFIVKNTGRVGIRTYSPGASLHVHSHHGTAFLIDRDGETHFTVDNTGRVGIGISGTPNAQLQIRQSNPLFDLLHLERGDATVFVAKKYGNIGIGTQSPQTKLHLQIEEIISSPSGTYHADKLVIEGTDAVLGLYSEDAGSVSGVISLGQIAGDGSLDDKWAILRTTPSADNGENAFLITHGTHHDPWRNSRALSIDADGDIGIGTTRINQDSRLFVISSKEASIGSDIATARIKNRHTNGIALLCENESNKATVVIKQDGDGALLRCWGRPGSGTSSTVVFQVRRDGRTVCSVLELTGGSDIAEPFEITGDSILPPGAVVVIDSDNPGKLKISNQPYDTRVAGIISGADGVKPGITLSQEGKFSKGQNVAMSGRVYCLADASYGPIQPGDLLTTSPTPGHAMVAADPARSYGTVIGKAMTALNDGCGLVLILVNLQ